MSIEIRCKCGQRLLVKDGQPAGQYPCPKCGGTICVTPSAPQTSVAKSSSRALSAPILAPPKARSGSIENFSQIDKDYLLTTGIGTLLLVYFMAWALLFVLAVGCLVALPAFGSVAMGSLAVGTLFLGLLSIELLFAKARVLSKGEQPLLFGLLKLIAWDPTHGIVILKNKTIHFVDDNLQDGGGIKLICPVFGDEVALRVPLEPQSLVFEDSDVLTKEYLPLHVRGTMKWRIASLEHFYLLVSTELHEASDRNRYAMEPTSAKGAPPPPPPVKTHRIASKLELAEEWLRWTAEEKTRIVVSRLSTGLLIADQIAAELPIGAAEIGRPRQDNTSQSPPSAPGNYQSATDGLAVQIYNAIAETVSQYGIEIHEVTLQQVRLPAAIHEQCVEACKAAYIPLIAQREALAKKMQLQAEADVIGADSVASREVVGAAPAYALGDFLAQFIAKNPGLARRPER